MDQDTDVVCCSTFILATAGPTNLIALVIAVSLESEISFSKVQELYLELGCIYIS